MNVDRECRRKGQSESLEAHVTPRELEFKFLILDATIHSIPVQHRKSPELLYDTKDSTVCLNRHINMKYGSSQSIRW
jgi:hypothetical protein